MQTGLKIVLGVGVIGAGIYVAMKHTKAPTLTVYTLNPIDGTGTFKWGKASGGIGTGTAVAGWGWTGGFINFVPGTGWSFQVFKNGTSKGTYPVTMVGDKTF
jgi:hypothetical protein